ncbi:DNA-binding protein Alba [Candidatus Pacearchaeota archaeon CG10_big_fil_rev_8_21_14_0_10_32_14]|nr:MAG: DNA-binding protein Alba [Candidatus Pacearchaeota archaeon CG10_big_fil_rev_8_21_14_0_10_32_14]
MAEENKQVISKTDRKDDNVVYIGSKPFMNYVTSVVVQFSSKNKKEVIIKARGKFITRAVDVAEVARKRFLEKDNIRVGAVKIDSEVFENQDKRMVNVSTIEIVLVK